MRTIRKCLIWLNIWRVLPAYLCYLTCKFTDKCRMDLDAWVCREEEAMEGSRLWQLGYFLVNQKECRNIFLNRLRRNPGMYAMNRFLFPPLETCYVSMPPEKLGGGFSFQHGFSTIVSAEEIGENCRVNQQVTIGYDGDRAPVLGDNVRVCAGAILIGDIHVGTGAIIGAGAVVVHDVPPGATVVGQAARVVRTRELTGESKAYASDFAK